MSKRTKARQQEINEAKDYLRPLLQPGSKVYVEYGKDPSRVNMTWYVRVFLVKDGEIVNITGKVADAIDWSCREVRGSWCLRGTGFGTDRAFEVGHNLSYALHGVRTEDAPEDVRKVREEADAAQKALEAVRAECGCDKKKRLTWSYNTCKKCAALWQAAREDENGDKQKYRAGYTIKGEWL